MFRLVYLSLFTFFILISTGSTFANETRGLRILAKDTASGQQKEVKIYNKSYAVIIGIDQYQNLPMDRQLTYAVRDAKGVAQAIEKNFKFDKMITLYNKDATREKILEVLTEELPKEMTSEDSLFVFWAGHGNQENTRVGDLGYLIPYDGSVEKIRMNITMSDIRDTISKKIPAKHVFYVMDACYGGLLAQTRAVDKQTKRDFAYIQEITKEPVIQVLTAGGKDQEVLDGGPNGHSVFTGRLIEALENAEDFITANELQVIVKEKVFSDARARNHTQTPGYGALYGVGDFVFVPSIEQKVENTQSKISDMQKEIDQLKATEEAALKAQDERARHQAELEKRAIEARLKAEQLKQQALEEERRKKEEAEKERLKQETELSQKKKADEERLAMLKIDVEEKRKTMGGTTLSSLSPEATLTDMLAIDAKIKEIKEQFRNELKNGINQIVQRLNDKFLKLADAKKDEFETEEEFQNRKAKEMDKLNSEQAGEFTAFQDRLEKEYNQQIEPFIEQLKKSSANEFTITAENLILELGTYDGASDTYPITIKTREPIKGILVAANANVPIPREEAREFKLHFTNNMLRPEIKGNFQSLKFFRIAQAYVIDDATNKKYDLFSSKFVDLENGIVYDSNTKLLWTKDPWYFRNLPNKGEMNWNDSTKACNNLTLAGITGWRLPSVKELTRMFTVYHGQEPHPFDVSVMKGYYWSNDRNEEYRDNYYYYSVSIEERDKDTKGWDRNNSQWCVRGSGN